MGNRSCFLFASSGDNNVTYSTDSQQATSVPLRTTFSSYARFITRTANVGFRRSMTVLAKIISLGNALLLVGSPNLCNWISCVPTRIHPSATSTTQSFGRKKSKPKIHWFSISPIHTSCTISKPPIQMCKLPLLQTGAVSLVTVLKEHSTDLTFVGFPFWIRLIRISGLTIVMCEPVSTTNLQGTHFTFPEIIRLSTDPSIKPVL